MCIIFIFHNAFIMFIIIREFDNGFIIDIYFIFVYYFTIVQLCLKTFLLYFIIQYLYLILLYMAVFCIYYSGSVISYQFHYII